MPIRFRCPVCQQLLGIARRKAGSNVRCPNCRNEVLVPAHDQDDDLNDEPFRAPAPGLFDRDDFDQLLHNAPGESARPRVVPPQLTPVPPTRAQPQPPARQVEVDLWPAPQPRMPPPGGIVLSPLRATMLTVVVIVLLAAAFAGGLVVGRFVL